jgi:hypothetical protein
VGGSRLCRSYQTGIIAPWRFSRGGKATGLHRRGKQCCKNDLSTSTDSSHDVPYTSWEYDQAVSETGPMIVVGSAKAQGSKVKPINGSELPRATRARGEVTQRVATSWHIRSPIEGT